MESAISTTRPHSPLERVFVIPELLDIIFSFLAPADLPCIADCVLLSSSLRHSILRQLHVEETTLFRVACAACRRRGQLPLLSKACRAVEYLRPQSPRTGPGTLEKRVWTPQCGLARPFDFLFDYTNPADFSRRFVGDTRARDDRLVCDPELYLDKSMGNHWLPTLDGGCRLVSLPIKQLVHALANLAHYNHNKEAMGFLLTKYTAFFPPGYARSVLSSLVDSFIRGDNVVSLAALIDVCPTLLSATFIDSDDTLLRRAIRHRFRPSEVVEMLIAKGVNLQPPIKSSDDLLPLEQAVSAYFPVKTICMLVEHGAAIRWTTLKRLAGPDGAAIDSGVEAAILPALGSCAEPVLKDASSDRFPKRIRKALRRRKLNR